MKFILFFIKCAIGILISGVFCAVVYTDPFSDWPRLFSRYSFYREIKFGIDAGILSPFFLPNYLAYLHQGKVPAVLISLTSALCFYSPFLIHWWHKVDLEKRGEKQ